MNYTTYPDNKKNYVPYTTYTGKKEWCVRKTVCPDYRYGSCNGCKGSKTIGDNHVR